MNAWIIFALGVLCGGFVIGWIAHHKPEWFAKVVKVADDIADSAKSGVAKLAPDSKPPSTAPPKT